jgi:hypothetical protein
LPAFKSNATIKSPTQVQNDFERIIRMSGTPAQPPKPRQKALGRQLGDVQIKRIRHPLVKMLLKNHYGFGLVLDRSRFVQSPVVEFAYLKGIA